MRVVTIVSTLIVIMLLLPVAVYLPGFPNVYRIAIAAMSWNYSLLNGEIYFEVGPIPLITGLPFTGIRVVFVLMVYRYYKGRTTKGRTLIVGVLSELQTPLAVLCLNLLSPFPLLTYPPVFPIPILFLVGVILMQINPVPTDIVWHDDSALPE